MRAQQTNATVQEARALSVDASEGIGMGETLSSVSSVPCRRTPVLRLFSRLVDISADLTVSQNTAMRKHVGPLFRREQRYAIGQSPNHRAHEMSFSGGSNCVGRAQRPFCCRLVMTHDQAIWSFYWVFYPHPRPAADRCSSCWRGKDSLGRRSVA